MFKMLILCIAGFSLLQLAKYNDKSVYVIIGELLLFLKHFLIGLDSRAELTFLIFFF